MTDTALEFAEEQGLGKVLERVRLDGSLALPDGGRARATLLLTSSGLWLVAARGRFDGLKLDPLTRGDLRLESGRVRDQLCFERQSLLIPTGRRGAVERLIALARFAPPLRARRSEVNPSRLVEAPDELGRAWLEHELDPGEVLVCWLRGSNTVALTSRMVGEVRARPFLFSSDRRAAIVAWSSVGDVSYTVLGSDALRVQAKADKLELSSGGALFVSRRIDVEATRDACELLALLEPKARLLEAARRTWLARGHDREPKHGACSVNLLHAAIERGSERARFARLLALVDESEAKTMDRAELARALSGERITPDALAELWAKWKFSTEAGGVLLRGLLEAGAQALPFALALQRRMHGVPVADEEIARDELRLARYAVEVRLSREPAVNRRDLALQAVLGPHALARAASNETPAQPQAALSPLMIESMLSHPLARGHGSLVGGVQKLVALAPEPDQVALSDYCEALDPSEQPAASRALAAARLAFALPTLHAYVSRGKKSIGLRGYESDTPYILLGKAHLDAASPYAMTEGELFFAFGAEALHLKLGQTRITSHDIWAGAFAHTKGGVELLLTLLPLVKGIPLGAGITKVLERIPEPALRRGLDALVRFEQGRRKTESESSPESALSLINENLLAAHRLMQMSADRAGLVLCGDLHASLRGLLLARPDYRALLEAMEQRDLVQVLALDEGQEAMRADLVVRVAALLEFYIGEDYVALREALTGAVTA